MATVSIRENRLLHSSQHAARNKLIFFAAAVL
jgi:hypothetical protein